MKNQLPTPVEAVSEVYQLREKYEKVEFFPIGRSNPYVEPCDTLCNERVDAEGF